MRVHTRQSVHDLIQSRWESDEPDKVLEALRPFDGKPITTRLLDKMPGGRERWRLRREYGMTHLETLTYLRSGGDAGTSLLFNWTEASVPLEWAQLEERNAAYFKGRRERNHARMEAMNTRETLDDIAEAMNDAEQAIEQLQLAQERIEELTDYGTPLNPERYAIEKACGLDDRDGRPLLNREYKTREPEKVEV